MPVSQYKEKVTNTTMWLNITYPSYYMGVSIMDICDMIILLIMIWLIIWLYYIIDFGMILLWDLDSVFARLSTVLLWTAVDAEMVCIRCWVFGWVVMWSATIKSKPFMNSWLIGTDLALNVIKISFYSIVWRLEFWKCPFTCLFK